MPADPPTDRLANLPDGDLDPLSLPPEDRPALASALIRGGGDGAADWLELDYDARFLRRKRLTSASGRPVMVDLPETVSLEQGDGLRLETGEVIGVEAAREPLLRVEGENLPRLAWHIGNRHTPCQIQPDRLVIRQDHVLEAMLRQLGAKIEKACLAFSPEGGAYGHGRTFGHDHGHAAGPGHHHHNDQHDHDHHHA
mgnify:CR=1 FL=1